MPLVACVAVAVAILVGRILHLPDPSRFPQASDLTTAWLCSLVQGVPEFGRFTLEDFIWGRFVVITRIFGLVVAGNKTDGALCLPRLFMLLSSRPMCCVPPQPPSDAT